MDKGLKFVLILKVKYEFLLTLTHCIIFCCSELEEALLRLPFSSVLHLIPQLTTLLELPQQPHTEIVCRSALFLVRVHHGPIMSTSSLLPAIRQLHLLASTKISELRVLLATSFPPIISSAVIITWYF